MTNGEKRIARVRESTLPLGESGSQARRGLRKLFKQLPVSRALKLANQHKRMKMPPEIQWLLNEDGTLNVALIEQLQADRDETPVLLTE